MDILILTCNLRWKDDYAEGIKITFNKEGHRAVMVNPYSLIGDETDIYVANELLDKPLGASFISEMAGKLPKKIRPTYSTSAYRFCEKASKWLKKYISVNHFDLIITTHVFQSEILANLRECGAELPREIFFPLDSAQIKLISGYGADACAVAFDVLEDYDGSILSVESLEDLTPLVRFAEEIIG